ncbi:MAG: hypothetical protein ACE5E9_01585 [Nitrospinaceae bacterium]
MKIKILFGITAAVLFASSPVLAKQELMLSKEQLFDGGPAIDGELHHDCEQLFYVDAGKDVRDMRYFPYYFCEGMYTLTLDGPPGTVVTLFGSFFFGKERGYLVIRKKDHEKVWILQLEDFPPGQWVTTQAERDSGAYEVYYQAAPNFRRNVSSIKWGKWWTGVTPRDVGSPVR